MSAAPPTPSAEKSSRVAHWIAGGVAALLVLPYAIAVAGLLLLFGPACVEERHGVPHDIDCCYIVRHSLDIPLHWVAGR